MKKFLKTSVAFSLVMITILSGMTIVKADGQWYNTTMSISHHSTLTGKERQYSFDYYRTELTPTWMEGSSYNSSNVHLLVQLVRPLYRLGIHYSDETKYSNYENFAVGTVNQKRNIYMGNCGDGKRYLYFSTWENNNSSGGSMKGKVDIYNYS